MIRYLALLGSINVGGNRIRMADLKAAMECAGFANVATVGASGNVIFNSDETAADALPQRIATLIADTFDIKTFAIVRTQAELRQSLSECPFHGVGEDKLVHVMFLDTQPSPGQFAQLETDHEGRGPEKLARGTRTLHIDYVDGVAASKLTKQFIERRLGCRGTARNVNSLRTLIGKFD